jgi:hypothetical protein
MAKEKDELVELKELEEELKNVLDEAAEDESVAFELYDIASYGADFDVEGLVKRLEREDIFIPHFQREYVWNINDASRFIESLLLGLPVPGVFLAREQETNRLLIIDGQQRLRSLQYFFDGYFKPTQDQQNRRVFKLSNVQERFKGRTYKDLEEKDRIRLGDSIIHATIIKQETPTDDDTSIYHVFERLNTGGRKLVAQEMRAALYHGKLLDLLQELNVVPAWRNIFGRQSNRLKDQELILRFLSLYYKGDQYQKPMSEFITRWAKKNKNPSDAFIDECRNLFITSINSIYDALGDSAFRPERVLNAGVFDSVMVAIAKRQSGGERLQKEKITGVYRALMNNQDYVRMVSISTSDAINVKGRLEISTSEFRKN